MRKIALASKVFKTYCFAAAALHAVVNLQTLAVAEEESILDQATVLTPARSDVDNQSIIERGFKSWFFDNEDDNGDGSKEVLIDFVAQARTPISMLFLNTARIWWNQIMISEAHVRVGSDATAYGTTNPIVRTGIVDGGIFPLEPQTGRYFTLRRVGPEPYRNEYNLMIT